MKTVRFTYIAMRPLVSHYPLSFRKWIIIFGARTLANEISLRFIRVVLPIGFKNHDTIFYYSKPSSMVFNSQYEPYSEAIYWKMFKEKDEDDRRYRRAG